MIRTLNMNSQSSDVDGKGDEYLVVVLYVASKTATPPSPPLGLLVIYLLFIYHLLFIYYVFIIFEYAHCPTPPSPRCWVCLSFMSRGRPNIGGSTGSVNKGLVFILSSIVAVLLSSLYYTCYSRGQPRTKYILLRLTHIFVKEGA